MDLGKIAEELYKIRENIILIYAFNGTGKTRLSVEYKNHTKKMNNNSHSGVYYNAFSEDLFVWDNDEENDNEDIKLKIGSSSLNRFHARINEDSIREKLEFYNPKYDFYFNTFETDPERGYESISFYVEGDDEQPIKISRGEERIFVWCFFLALFEVEGWADVQSDHFFIDDPVSSLDDHNIFVTASTILNLLESQIDEERKIIITSHHFGFLSILSDWLGKGEKANKFRNRDKAKKYKEFFLEVNQESYKLTNPRNGVVLFHLRLLQILYEAKESNIYTYHFVLMRQVLENIASFLGVGQISFVLKEIGIDDTEKTTAILNALSHQKVFQYKSEFPEKNDKDLFIEIFTKLRTKYNFALHVG